MRIPLGIGLLLVTAVAVAQASGEHTRREPTAEQVDALIAMGWQEGAEAIENQLLEEYEPGRLGLSGSTGREAFRAWMDLWRWFELMSRTEDACLADLLGQMVFRVEDGEQMTVVPPGIPKPPGLVSLPPELREKLVESQDGLRKLLPLLVLEGYEPQGRTLAEILGDDLAEHLARDSEFLREYFATLTERDFLPGVMLNLRDLYRSMPSGIRSYRSVATAMALVFDQQRPQDWPHHQVEPEALPEAEETVVDRFKFWVDSNESGKLLNDLRGLSAAELKFVVDTFVPIDELVWAQSNLRLVRANFHRAFGEVKYDHPRIMRAQFRWPGDEYRLASIKANGGICVDQAYFAMLSGKALGLPTLFFAGQGSDGGHAWFGYLKSPGKWELDCGRYENQNYAVGQALDPQTWLPISDHELEFLSEGFRNRPEFIASAHDLVMARLLEEAGFSEKAKAAVASAIETEPMNLDAWGAKAALLKESEADEAELRAHFEAASKQFSRFDDIQAEFLAKVADVARRSGDVNDAAKIESRIMHQNRRDRSDLSIRIGAERLASLVDEGKLEDALVEYRSQITRLAPTGGGNFFYDVVRPFVVKLAATGDHQNAERALEMGRRALGASPGSILDQEFATLEESIEPR